MRPAQADRKPLRPSVVPLVPVLVLVDGHVHNQTMATNPQIQPKNLVVVLLDSLNRHMLGAYGGGEFDTPNLDRFAARSTRFDRPRPPARCRACQRGHDILCGALDFLWKPWGSIELWEESITAALRRSGVHTMLATDHPHIFETGGENFHTDFGAWGVCARPRG